MDLICSLLFIPITVVYNFTRKCNKYRCTLSFNTIRPNSSIMRFYNLFEMASPKPVPPILRVRALSTR